MKVGVHAHGGGGDACHGVGNEEEAQHGGKNDDKRHFRHAPQHRGLGVERLAEQFAVVDGAFAQHGTHHPPEGNHDDGGSEKHPFHLRHGAIFGAHLAGNHQINCPGEQAQQRKANAEQVVFAGARSPSHHHHQHSAGNADEHAHRFQPGDFFVDECGSQQHHGYWREGGKQREIYGLGECQRPGGEGLRYGKAHHAAHHDNQQIFALHFFFGHQCGKQPKNEGGSQAAEKHIAVGREVMVHQVVGNGHAQSEHGVGNNHRGMTLKISLIHNH